jgi:hypothetical protein
VGTNPQPVSPPGWNREFEALEELPRLVSEALAGGVICSVVAK